MVKSMTAYGRASQSTPQGRFVVEIHSVNRKMLDLSVHLPKDLLRFEVEVRKWLASVIERGQITARITLQSEGLEGALLENQLKQLKSLKKSCEQMARELGYDPEKMIDLRFLMEQLQTFPPTENKEEEEVLRKVLKGVVEDCLKHFVAMKQVEGNALAEDIQLRLNKIQEAVDSVELRKEEPLSKYSQRIKERLEEFSSSAVELQERVAKEVALLAEKMDVTEEIVRLRSHLDQFRGQFSSQEKSVGRMLEFLVQEMNREVNTLGAKSADSEVSLLIVLMKSELEKIREQVQNIE